MIAPFFPLSVYARFAGLPTAKCWDRAFGDSQPLWSVGATMRKVRGRLVCKGPGFVGVGALGCDSLSAVERWVVSPEFGLGRRLAFRFRQRESSGPWVRPLLEERNEWVELEALPPPPASWGRGCRRSWTPCRQLRCLKSQNRGHRARSEGHWKLMKV